MTEYGMRMALLLTLLFVTLLGAQETKEKVPPSAAPPVYEYQLSMQFGFGSNAPTVTKNVALGQPFTAQKDIESESATSHLYGFGGQIEEPRNGVFSGVITYIDWTVPKGSKGHGGCGCFQAHLELGKPFGISVSGGIVQVYTVTLTKKH